MRGSVPAQLQPPNTHRKVGKATIGGKNGIAVVMETSRKGAALIAYVGIDLSVSA